MTHQAIRAESTWILDIQTHRPKSYGNTAPTLDKVLGFLLTERIGEDRNLKVNIIRQYWLMADTIVYGVYVSS